MLPLLHTKTAIPLQYEKLSPLFAVRDIVPPSLFLPGGTISRGSEGGDNFTGEGRYIHFTHKQIISARLLEDRQRTLATEGQLRGEGQPVAERKTMTLTFPAPLFQLASEYWMDLYIGHHPESEKASDIWRNVRVDQCCVCGTREGVTRAHIVLDRHSCERHGLEYEARSNMLPLCGTRQPPINEDWGCHAYFGKKLMGFVHNPSKNNWLVFGGPHHDKEVQLHNNPHHKVLHSHLLLCLLRGDEFKRHIQLGLTQEAKSRIKAWAEKVTQQSPGKDSQQGTDAASARVEETTTPHDTQPINSLCSTQRTLASRRGKPDSRRREDSRWDSRGRGGR